MYALRGVEGSEAGQRGTEEALQRSKSTGQGQWMRWLLPHLLCPSEADPQVGLQIAEERQEGLSPSCHQRDCPRSSMEKTVDDHQTVVDWKRHYLGERREEEEEDAPAHCILQSGSLIGEEGEEQMDHEARYVDQPVF